MGALNPELVALFPERCAGCRPAESVIRLIGDLVVEEGTDLAKAKEIVSGLVRRDCQGVPEQEGPGCHLDNCGIPEDPNYYRKLGNVIRQNGLQSLDSK